MEKADRLRLKRVRKDQWKALPCIEDRGPVASGVGLLECLDHFAFPQGRRAVAGRGEGNFERSDQFFEISGEVRISGEVVRQHRPKTGADVADLTSEKDRRQFFETGVFAATPAAQLGDNPAKQGRVTLALAFVYRKRPASLRLLQTNTHKTEILVKSGEQVMKSVVVLQGPQRLFRSGEKSHKLRRRGSVSGPCGFLHRFAQPVVGLGHGFFQIRHSGVPSSFHSWRKASAMSWPSVTCWRMWCWRPRLLMDVPSDHASAPRSAPGKIRNRS